MAASHSHALCYQVARPSMPVIRISFARLTTTSAAQITTAREAAGLPPARLKSKPLLPLPPPQDRPPVHDLVLALRRVPSLFVAAGLWPVDLVGRAVLCPPCQGQR